MCEHLETLDLGTIVFNNICKLLKICNIFVEGIRNNEENIEIWIIHNEKDIVIYIDRQLGNIVISDSIFNKYDILLWLVKGKDIKVSDLNKKEYIFYIKNAVIICIKLSEKQYETWDMFSKQNCKKNNISPWDRYTRIK